MQLMEPKVQEGGQVEAASMNEMAKMNLNRLRKSSALSLSCVNHISRKCSNLQASKKFYENLLGFVEVRRPDTLNFDGAWLFNYGIGIHLLQDEDPKADTGRSEEIEPNDDHISFQCEDVNDVEEILRKNGVKYLRREIEEDGIMVDQIFFHDPDHFMIEVCNCDQLPVVPLARAASLKNQQQFFSCKRMSSLSSYKEAAVDAESPH